MPICSGSGGGVVGAELGGVQRCARLKNLSTRSRARGERCSGPPQMQDVLAGAVGGGGVEAFTRDAVLLALRQPEAAPRGSEERERTSLAIGAGRGGVEARAHGAGRPCGAERRRWRRWGAGGSARSRGCGTWQPHPLSSEPETRSWGAVRPCGGGLERSRSSSPGCSSSLRCGVPKRTAAPRCGVPRRKAAPR